MRRMTNHECDCSDSNEVNSEALYDARSLDPKKYNDLEAEYRAREKAETMANAIPRGDVCEVLTGILKQRKISISKLALYMNIERSYLARILNKKREMPQEILILICLTLRFPPEVSYTILEMAGLKPTGYNQRDRWLRIALEKMYVMDIDEIKLYLRYLAGIAL